MNTTNPNPKFSRWLDADRLEEEIKLHKSEYAPDPELEGTVGVTMFDVAGSKDHLVTVLVHKENLKELSFQTFVEIRSRIPGGELTFQGIVVEGPFYQPDGLQADAPIIVTTAVNGMTFVPNYHGRVHIKLIAQVESGRSMPPWNRPLPNSPVFVTDPAAAEIALGLTGDITLGLALGHENLKIKFPSDTQTVLPRHLAVLGARGSGKSHTVCTLVHQFQNANLATVLVDTKGEYSAHLAQFVSGSPGMPQFQVFRPTCRATSRPTRRACTDFSLSFAQVSPYIVMEILDLTRVEQETYLDACDLAREMLLKSGRCPTQEADQQVLNAPDLMERGFPGLHLSMLHDLVRACALCHDPTHGAAFRFESALFAKHQAAFWEVLAAFPPAPSRHAAWRSLNEKLARLRKLGIFSDAAAHGLDFAAMTQPGTVSVIDLSDTESLQVNKLVIAEMLRGLSAQQSRHFSRTREADSAAQNRVMLLLEDAHEFFAAHNGACSPTLLARMTKAARLGKNHWLGLGYLSHLPHHLPEEILAMVHSFVLHKIGDEQFINRLRRFVGDLDEILWEKLPSLPAGQAVVSAPHLSRALLVAVDAPPTHF